jgi:DMSO/TMAO reductase YedYZ molybdopterin-dependent catalytic subunit
MRNREVKVAVESKAVACDPKEALRRAREAGLLVLREHPLNCETSIQALSDGAVVPNARFYIRNHFPIPKLDAATFRLTVSGLVGRPLSLSLDDLRQMRSQTLTVALECAGNGRALFHPPVEGENWGLGAVGSAEWTGVPLVEILERAGVLSETREALFRGADGGTLDSRSEPVRYERSLSVKQARYAGRLLAYEMNGEPLSAEHGYPLRLIVADWYGMASVKWLTEIELIGEPFAGHYQAEEYCYEWEHNDQIIREPATLQRVRALITRPAPNQEVACGELAIHGLAWSGRAPIARVEVSVGDGPWQEAKLVGGRTPHNWQPWELITRVLKVGARTLRARATDLAGYTQPEMVEWNRRGYGNNSVHRVQVVFRDRI